MASLGAVISWSPSWRRRSPAQPSSPTLIPSVEAPQTWSPEHVPPDLIFIRAAVELVGNADIRVAEEIFDEGEVLRAAVELGGNSTEITRRPYGSAGRRPGRYGPERAPVSLQRRRRGHGAVGRAGLGGAQRAYRRCALRGEPGQGPLLGHARQSAHRRTRPSDHDDFDPRVRAEAPDLRREPRVVDPGTVRLGDEVAVV